jgi:hypothetical protein|nr:MAG TPA: hypothetical protein [Caudoviricetes sp.]
MNIDQIKYGGCLSLELRGYKENHLRLESTQLFEFKSSVYEYLSIFFNAESMTQLCDSYDIRISVVETVKESE